ncbi:hypothetical protein PRUPE_2G139100 [Prunus persica]|uniref:tyrosine--tRNA ligase n=1 Tax=Prunus persica TaxID=3760 RepID=A0A251QFL2_PRUPE|nr:hypothetical protein PRUPE_2G139100 [Prunus persica]
MSLEEKFQMLRSVAEECIQDYEVRNLLAHKSEPIAYDGFEPSGRMHILLRCFFKFSLTIIKFITHN